MNRLPAYAAVIAALAMSALSQCPGNDTSDPAPSQGTLCGTRPDQLIYCYPSPTVSGMDPK